MDSSGIHRRLKTPSAALRLPQQVFPVPFLASRPSRAIEFARVSVSLAANHSPLATQIKWDTRTLLLTRNSLKTKETTTKEVGHFFLPGQRTSSWSIREFSPKRQCPSKACFSPLAPRPSNVPRSMPLRPVASFDSAPDWVCHSPVAAATMYRWNALLPREK
jgi:hypothetical protein